MTKQDEVFMVRFSSVLGFLVLFTILIALLARHIHAEEVKIPETDKSAMINSRIAPVGDVYVGEVPAEAQTTAPVQVAAASAAESTEPAAIDAAALFQTSCFACHGTGAAGAPKLQKAAWEPRIAQGRETLIKHALGGFNAMPPRGGSALSDTEIEAVIDYMIETAGNN
ncbi:MAG: c-type cytochrome [bacterium]